MSRVLICAVLVAVVAVGCAETTYRVRGSDLVVTDAPPDVLSRVSMVVAEEVAAERTNDAGEVVLLLGQSAKVWESPGRPKIVRATTYAEDDDGRELVMLHVRMEGRPTLVFFTWDGADVMAALNAYVQRLEEHGVKHDGTPRAVEVERPEATAATDPPPEPMVIAVASNDRVLLNDREVAMAELRQELKKAHPDQSVRIDVERDVPFKYVVHVMDVCKSQGLTNVGVRVRD